MKIYAPLNTDLDCALQEIEVATFFQLPYFHIIGLPGPEVAEARERIRAAFQASGFEFPRKKVVLNLSPASMRKRGTGLDLSMALSLLQLNQESVSKLGKSEKSEKKHAKVSAWGELALDGTVKPAGQLTRLIYSAWKSQVTQVYFSKKELPGALAALKMILEAEELEHQLPGTPPQLIPVNNLREAWGYLRKGVQTETSELHGLGDLKTSQTSPSPDLQPALRFAPNPTTVSHLMPLLMPLSPLLERAVGVAAAGRHHMMLFGPKGTGKTHALEWLSSLQTTYSAQLKLQNQLLVELGEWGQNGDLKTKSETEHVLVRRVGAQAKPAALMGNAKSSHIQLGEFSLAHGGLLLADEFPEWHRDSRELLREPLETGKITLSRVHGKVELPARFQLAGSGNLCPCGGIPPYFPQMDIGQSLSQPSQSRCRCTDAARKNYLAKISGPILDRIDLLVWVTQPVVNEGRPCLEKTLNHQMEGTLKILREKVIQAQKKLRESWGAISGEMTGAFLESLINEHPEFQHQLSGYSELSLRSRHKLLRVALTLAAFDQLKVPQEAHFSEAYFYRNERFFK